MVAAGVCYLAYAVAFALPTGLAALALPCAAASFIAATAFVGAAIPLFFDSAAEHVFGKGPEGAMLMGLVLPLNFVTLAVLFAPAVEYRRAIPPPCAPTARPTSTHPPKCLARCADRALTPALQSSFFVWINWGVAGVTLASAAALAAFVPASLERFDFDIAAAATAAAADRSGSIK